jgi:hypothetical protein
MTSRRRTPTGDRQPRPLGNRGPGRVRPVDRAVAGSARLAGAAIGATGRGQGATLPRLLAERCARASPPGSPRGWRGQAGRAAGLTAMVLAARNSRRPVLTMGDPSDPVLRARSWRGR